MALVLTLVAIIIGTGLGIRWGGDLSNATSWRPLLWEALAGGMAVIVLMDLVGITGGFASLLTIVATAAILTFTVINIRTGGMILVATGVALNLLVTLINWGMPVSGSALVRTGLVDRARLPDTVLTGGRSVADGPRLGWLGDVIPLPWGQVISFGDILILCGTALVTASVIRGATVGHQHSRYRRGGSIGYADSLSALSRGPAPRRGPGLHPSRLGSRSDRRTDPRRGRPLPPVGVSDRRRPAGRSGTTSHGRGTGTPQRQPRPIRSDRDAGRGPR